MIRNILAVAIATLTIGISSPRADTKLTWGTLSEVNSVSEQDNSDIAGFVANNNILTSDCPNHRVYIVASDKHLVAMAMSASLNAKSVGVTYMTNVTSEAASGHGGMTCRVLNILWN